MTLIRSGCFHEQARLLVETATIDTEGNLHCPTRTAQTIAPQLVAILLSWEEVQLRPEFVIPSSLVQELNTAWALLPPESTLPRWAAERRAVGDRAEMYSVQLERSRVRPDLIAWVARDSDAFGYDVEDRSTNPSRCIEVKGSRDNDVIFYISEREWQRAQELGSRYEVQFWGGIDLRVEPAIEYAALRAAGYPLTIPNFAASVGVDWIATPVKWRITKATNTVAEGTPGTKLKNSNAPPT